MELSELSKKRLEGVDERLKAIVIECAARCLFPFNVSEGLRSVEQQREYVRQGKSRTMNSKHLTGKAVDLYPLSMDRKQVDWSRFEELADLMFQVASEQGTEIVWGCTCRRKSSNGHPRRFRCLVRWPPETSGPPAPRT